MIVGNAMEQVRKWWRERQAKKVRRFSKSHAPMQSQSDDKPKITDIALGIYGRKRL